MASPAMSSLVYNTRHELLPVGQALNPSREHCLSPGLQCLFLYYRGYLTELFVTVGWGCWLLKQEHLWMLFNKSNSQADQNGRESKWAQEVCLVFILRLHLSQWLGPGLSLSQWWCMENGKEGSLCSKAVGFCNEALCGEGSKPLSISGEARTFAFYPQAILGGLEDLHSHS